MQLTDQTVTAAGLSCGSCAARTGMLERDSIVSCRRDSAVPVGCLDRSAVEDEDEQQQTEATLQVGALVLECSHQHAGHCRLCVRVLRLPNCSGWHSQKAIHIAS